MNKTAGGLRHFWQSSIYVLLLLLFCGSSVTAQTSIYKTLKYPFYDAGSTSSCITTGSTTGGLVWPFATKDPSQYNRVDQGWDIQDKAGAAIYAIAPGKIHVYSPNPGGFGNDYPTEELDSSIGGPTSWVYYGHVHVLPSVNDQHVDAGQQIAVANTTDPENGSAAPPGWLEIGFAQPGTDAPFDSGSGATAAGQKMKDLLLNATPGASASQVTPGSASSNVNCGNCDCSSLVGADNEEKIWNYFRGKGLGPKQTAALMGNFESETCSTWDPRIVNDPTCSVFSDSPVPGKAFGIAQWMGGRQDALVKKANQAGVIPGTLCLQLDFAWGELNSPSYKSLVLDPINATDDLATMVHIINQSYEASGTSDQPRYNYAVGILAKYGNGSSLGSSSSCSGGPITVPPGTGQQLALDLLQKHYQGTINGHSYSGDGNLTCQSLNCQDLDNTAHGVSIKQNGGPCSADALGTDLMQYLTVIIEQGGFSLSISALCNDHSAGSSTGNSVSAHNVGEAVDINFVNKIWLCDASSENGVLSLLQYTNGMIGSPLAPSQLLNQGVAAGQGCSQADNYILANDNLSMDGHKSYPKFTSKFVGDHENHVHVGY